MYLIQQVQRWTKGQVSAGAKGLELTLNTIDHMFEHNDWTPLAALITGVESRDGATLRAILGKVVGGITAKKDDKAIYGLKIIVGDNAAPTDLMPVLRQLVADGKSFRGAEVREQLLAKEPAPADFMAYMKRFYSKLEKEHWTVAQVIGAIQTIAQEKVIDGKVIEA